MLKSLLLLYFFGLILLPQDAHAAKFCEGHTPEVEIIPTFGHIEKDRSLRAVNLNSQDAWGDLMVDHIEGKSSLKSHNSFTVHTAKTGTDVCVALSQVKILYKLDVTLKVVDDYPKDSCEYKETIKHEERHIAVAKDFLAQTSPLLRDYVLENMKGSSTVIIDASHTDRAEVKLNKTMNNLLEAYSQHLLQEHRKAQRQVVDIPDERAKIIAACPDWKHPHAYK